MIKQRKICFALITFAVASTLAAQRVNAQRASIDVQGNVNAVVRILNGQTINEEGQGKKFVFTGNSNKIRITGDCASFTLSGSDNEVELDRVGNVNLVGRANRVTYLSALDAAEPTISTVGSDDTVTRREPAQAAPAQQPPPQTPATANAAPGTRPPGQDLIVNQSGIQLEKEMNGEGVTVNGSGNHLTLTGNVKSLIVYGAGCDIKTTKLGSIVLYGNGNRIFYSSKEGKPVVTDHGEGNTITAQD
jgi:hypothetical protein